MFRRFIRTFWPLGFVAFGGPQAHVALMHARYVEGDVPDAPRVSDEQFIELFALAQALPGPSSTQLATALGAIFGGVLGGVITFFIWQLPGFLLMSFMGLLLKWSGEGPMVAQTVHLVANYMVGLVAAAFAMVVIATVKIARRSCYDDELKIRICVLSALIAITIPPAASSWVFVMLLVFGGVAVYQVERGFRRNQTDHEAQAEDNQGIVADSSVHLECGISHNVGYTLVGTYAVITFIVLITGAMALDFRLRVLETFWRIGSTVIGGGQVVLPMLLNEVIEAHWLPETVFLIGFALIGCSPGPMFNIGPFLGAAMLGWTGALLTGVALFFPGISLILGLLPFWEKIRQNSAIRSALSGVNAAATGLIVAGVWMLLRRAIVGPAAFGLAIVAATLNIVEGVSPPVTILTTGFVGAVFVMFGIGRPYQLTSM